MDEKKYLKLDLTKEEIYKIVSESMDAIPRDFSQPICENNEAKVKNDKPKVRTRRLEIISSDR